LVNELRPLTPRAGELPTISIVVASKNRHADVLRCIESIAHQSFPPKEIIVVDQSPTPYVLPSDARLHHIHDATISGAAGARNVGWRETTADVVFFTDDDAELMPRCLEEIARGFLRYPTAVALQCALLTPETRSNLQVLYGKIFERGFFDTAPIRRGETIELRKLGSCAMAVRREVYELERFDESLVGYSFGEDWELSQRLRRYGQMFFLPEPLVIHHKSRVNRQEFAQLQRDRWDNYLYFFDKHCAERSFSNRIWRLWWMLGESLRWARYGLGFPILGITARETPSRSLSLRRDQRSKP
jgi:GT2 family glycosyltransferase